MSFKTQLIEAKRLQLQGKVGDLILKDECQDQQNCSILPLLLSQYATAIIDPRLPNILPSSFDSKYRLPQPLFFAISKLQLESGKLDVVLKMLLAYIDKKNQNNHHILLYNISKVWEYFGQIGKQIFFLQRLLKEAPFFSWAAYDLALCFSKTPARIDEGLGLLERHVNSLNSENPLIHAGIIHLASRSNFSSNHLARLLNSKKITYRNYYNLGVYFLKKGDLQKAEMLFSELSDKMQALKAADCRGWTIADNNLFLLSKINLLKTKHKQASNDTSKVLSSFIESHQGELNVETINSIYSFCQTVPVNTLQIKQKKLVPLPQIRGRTAVLEPKEYYHNKQNYFDYDFSDIRRKNNIKLQYLLQKEKNIDMFFKNLKIKENADTSKLTVCLTNSIQSAKLQLNKASVPCQKRLGKQSEQVHSVQESFQRRKMAQESRFSGMNMQQAIHNILLSLNTLYRSPIKPLTMKSSPPVQPAQRFQANFLSSFNKLDSPSKKKYFKPSQKPISIKQQQDKTFNQVASKTRAEKSSWSKKFGSSSSDRFRLLHNSISDRTQTKFRIKPMSKIQVPNQHLSSIDNLVRDHIQILKKPQKNHSAAILLGSQSQKTDDRGKFYQKLSNVSERNQNNLREMMGQVKAQVSSDEDQVRGQGRVGDVTVQGAIQDLEDQLLKRQEPDGEANQYAVPQGGKVTQCAINEPYQAMLQNMAQSSKDEEQDSKPSLPLIDPKINQPKEQLHPKQLSSETIRTPTPQQPQTNFVIPEPPIPLTLEQNLISSPVEIEAQPLQPRPLCSHSPPEPVNSPQESLNIIGQCPYDPFASTFNLTGFGNTQLNQVSSKPNPCFSDTFNIFQQAFGMKSSSKPEPSSEEFEAKIFQIRQLKNQNNLEEAYSRLRQLYKQFKGEKQKLQILLTIGQVFEKQQRMAQAQKTYIKCTKFNSAEAFLALGSLQLKIDKVQEGVQNLQKANCLKRFDLQIQNRLVYGYSMQEQTMEKALNLAHNILKKQPNSIETLLITAGILQRQGKLEEAIQIVGAMDEVRKAEYIKHYLGILYLESSNLKEAFKCFKSALAMKPDYVPSLIEVASIISQVHPQEAIAILTKVLQLSPGNRKALARLGKIYEAESDFQNAMLTYKTGLQRQVNYQSYMKIGDCLNKKESYIEALLNYKEALNLKKTHQAYTKVALMYELKGEYTRAIQYYQLALSVLTQDGQTWQVRRSNLMSIGRLNVLLGLYDGAIMSLEEMIQGQASIDVLQLLGEAYFGNKQYHLALSSLEKANALANGTNLTILQTIAMCLDRMEEYLASKAIYEKILEKNPDNLRCLNNLGNILLITGQTNQAFYLFESLLEKAPKNLEKRLKVADIYAEVGDWSKVEYHLLQCYRLKEHDTRILEKLILLYKQKRDSKMAAKYQKKLALLRANHKSKTT